MPFKQGLVGIKFPKVLFIELVILIRFPIMLLLILILKYSSSSSAFCSFGINFNPSSIPFSSSKIHIFIIG